MSERQRGEKDEKREEKEEKGRRPGEAGRGRGEKNWEEKWRRDPLSLVLWAAVFIWAGIVLLADNFGLLSGLTPAVSLGSAFTGPISAWALILLGAGVIVLLGVVARLVYPELRRPVGGTIVLGIILVALGLSGFISWGVLWPVILIAIGLAIVLTRVFARREP